MRSLKIIQSNIFGGYGTTRSPGSKTRTSRHLRKHRIKRKRKNRIQSESRRRNRYR